jgi:hypothetical protein
MTIRLALVTVLALTLGGCLTEREWLLVQSQYYSRGDIDALNAGAQCKALARNLVQVARCDNRR